MLTLGKWVGYIKFVRGGFADDTGKRIAYRDGASVERADIGCYPLVTFHRPSWLESIWLSHDAVMGLARWTDSDFDRHLPKVYGATVPIPIPDEPGWTIRADADRLCKHPLKVTHALSNRQFVETRNGLLGGLGTATEAPFNRRGAILSGLDQNVPGAGHRATRCLDYLIECWNRATRVTLHVKLRWVREPYVYDITPSTLGWEPGYRNGEAD